jgi:pyruvate dehydrogenase E2 component (dihydrolipoamide acetyltransferase)
MAVEFVMPRMGLTMEEGAVVKWHKQVGEQVKKGELLVEIETDKVTTEVESNADGILGKILIAEGVSVPIGTPIAYIIAPGELLPEPESANQVAQTTQGSKPNIAFTDVTHTRSSSDGQNLRASPAARRAARELNLELEAIEGHGPQGRILETDVRRAWAQIKRAPERRATPLAARVAADKGIDLSQVQGSGPRGRIRKSDLLIATAAQEPEGEFIELSSAHKVMAERMAASFQTAPHFYLVTEADASALVNLRQNLLPKIEATQGIRLTYTDLLAFFLAKALAEQPMVNAAWADGQIRLNPDVNLGIAVDSPRGLIVPVIHTAEKLSLGQIAQARSGLTEKARAGSLSLDDLAGGTFTLSNLGAFRVDTFNAVLNPPQAAILAVGQIHDKVVPHEGQPAIRPVIGLSLTCDHRVLDGAAGARFLTRLVELIEEPYSFFI